MPSQARGYRRGICHEKTKKTTSFHGRGSLMAGEVLLRPRTVPELVSGMRAAEEAPPPPPPPPKPAKLLVNVTIQRSTGAVHVLLSPSATAEELIAAALRQYVKEARRPVLPSAEASAFNLHYSQFTLESLDRKEKLVNLGSRNFFLFPKLASAGVHGGPAAAAPNCSKEADTIVKKGLPWLKFMNFLL